ncbi:MAG: chromosome partitioning protein ParB [Candidatus Parabeggiatoa sp. nov. 1]|nr:MAG: chromosome partitioning protein ParB [Gammaproteobacteria bacterium]
MQKSKVEYIPLDNLELDPENPRLPEQIKRTQKEMLTYIARETSIEDLMTVIAENGFFDGEALIVYPIHKKPNKYYVIEGNRRLTAVRLLNDWNMYPKRKRIREIADSAKHKPEQLPVIVYDKREEVLTYLGHRHITGVKAWEPLAKARYMHQLFKLTDSSQKPVVRYRELARQIGSRRDYIKKSLDALAVYNIIEENGFYNIDELDESTISFSLLSGALGYEYIRYFVSVGTDPIVDTSRINTHLVEKLTRWMFEKGTHGETLLGESINLGKLAKVLSNSKAYNAIMRGANLESAYRMTSGIKDDFLNHLYVAQSKLQDANAIVASLDKLDKNTFDLSKDTAKLAVNVYRTLETMQRKDDEFDI